MYKQRRDEFSLIANLLPKIAKNRIPVFTFILRSWRFSFRLVRHQAEWRACMCACVRVCMRVCVRACVRACVCVYMSVFGVVVAPMCACPDGLPVRIKIVSTKITYNYYEFPICPTVKETYPSRPES